MQTLPRKLYLAQQVRELDRIAIEDCGMKGIKLMRTAAAAVFQYIQQHYTQTKHIAVFCGSGNNAGDGYFIALLALQANFKVSVYSIGSVEKLTSDALIAYQDYKKQGGSTYSSQTLTQTPDLIIDALLETGLTRDISGTYAEAVKIINQTPCPVIAVDIPSGIHADTGCMMGSAVKADATVSFIGLKQGLFTGTALDYCGKLIFDDLNVPKEVFTRVQYSSERLEKTILPPRLRNSHKGNFGHVLIIGGDTGFSGAARLAAESALRSGAGLVSLATHPSHASLLNIGRFELMCHGIEQPSQLQALLEKATVIVIGTGLGQKQWGKSLFDVIINSTLPMIVDADGLNLLAQSPNYNNNRIITPHPKEAARLLNCSTTEISENRFLAVKKIQSRYGGVCLLKGAGTLISDADELFINTTGNAGMATAGMGDVLAGIIGGLVAQGLSLTTATTTASYIHGAAADLAAVDGERGLLASDLMPYIRKLVN
ncbi:MAG: NAD(P)H-hydrate dehydratase [Methylococcaceae bacterium]|nr:NAD(P)H-hydrate dehydratase [Methylococcaceae bacterium]